ncbi:phage antirepressor KilAC domain-containing protein [Pseudomonas sp. 10S4]|uniref:phage antirepressor KilAC domain-containing protein n=1 Tax=Pseudomonas sp. 10S4 TaxID=3048583 RepID=UPI002AC95636|nr:MULTISPECIES: phage antirepressor KilAC domain-containing protein [unclassified Pseudomonas]MEB0226281.1 phage antirepressor KilAC domain-containing protein [Pseudomonas sp. 5S1]MEB0294898.1 phage antirepressor KilAC domain-containing protein [Pseudomonas sp. 10S4]WPX18155.1 phage antirepressor KilAC domain-containing protein [Pseudomonas sp. 10S4]
MNTQSIPVNTQTNVATRFVNFENVSRTEIVSLVDGEAVTTTLAIAAGCEVDHASVIKLARTYQSDLQEFGLLDFKSESTGGRPTEFALLNEQQSTLILTYMRNSAIVREFKKRLVKDFWRLVHAKPAFDYAAALNDPRTLLALLTDNVKKVVALEADNTELSHENLMLEQKVAADAPKTAFFDAVTVTHETYSVAEAAKLIGTGQNRLMAFLRQRRWVTIRKNEPMQGPIESGYLTAKLSTFEHPENGKTTVSTPRVTGKGLTKLQALWARRDADLLGGPL